MVLEIQLFFLLLWGPSSRKHGARSMYSHFNLTYDSMNGCCVQTKKVSLLHSYCASTSFVHYLGSQHRCWIFFFALPVLYGVFSPCYLHHLALLVASLHILYSDHITSEDLTVTDQYLSRFYTSFPDLYGMTDMSCSSQCHYSLVPRSPRPTFRHLQYRKVGNGGREDLIRLGRSLIVPMPEVAQLTAHLQASISTLPTSVAAVVRHDSQGAKVSLPRHLGVFWQVCGPTACN